LNYTARFLVETSIVLLGHDDT